MINRILHKLFCRQKEYITRFKRDSKNRVTTIYLECLNCQYQTKGWKLDENLSNRIVELFPDDSLNNLFIQFSFFLRGIMPTFNESVSYENLFCLFKGEPGTRKSTCALSFPKPIYFFDYDGKMDALGLPVRDWKVDPTQIVSDYYSNWDNAKRQLELFQAQCKYKTIVIDSITSLADAINRQTLKTKSADGGSGKKVGTIPVNSIEDFNAEDSALKEMIALCKEIKKQHKVNIILIAHVVQKEMKTADGKTHMARLIVTAGKSIAQKIPAYCSEIYHFNVKAGFDVRAGGQYALWTVHTGDDFARSSLPLESEIVFGNEPLYEKWIAPAIEKMTDKP